MTRHEKRSHPTGQFYLTGLWFLYGTDDSVDFFQAIGLLKELEIIVPGTKAILMDEPLDALSTADPLETSRPVSH